MGGGWLTAQAEQADPMVAVVAWSRDGSQILYASAAGRPHRRDSRIFAVDPGGGLPRELPYQRRRLLA